MNSTLHYVIMKHFVDYGYGPTIETLSKEFDMTRETAIIKLRELQDYHGVVLHPTSAEIWVSHPFSNAPTTFCVQNEVGQKWWGNCAWCSLGIAALLKGQSVKITTTLGAETKQIVVNIVNGKVLEENLNLFIHFPIPMGQVWDNVVYTCSLQLIFDSEAAVDDWCARHNINKGSVVPLAKFWKFAKKWYGNHLNKDWKKWTKDEAQSLFNDFGLTGPIWEISSSGMDSTQRF